MMPSEAAVSVIVGMVVLADVVPAVNPAGPTPTIPSTPVNPVAVEATPMDKFEIVNVSPSETVSVYSSPENEPEP